MISVTEKEIAQSVAEHTAANIREEEQNRGFSHDSEPQPEQEIPVQTPSKPKRDYGFNTADLQAELAKSMRDIVAGIRRKPDESDIVEPVNDIAEQAADGVSVEIQKESIMEQNPIDDILMSMSSVQQTAAAAEKENETEEAAKPDTDGGLAAAAETSTEKLMTDEEQSAVSNMDIELNGTNSSARIVSRSVGKGNSKQVFHPRAIGNNRCHAHVQCDSIIMDQAEISSIPEINAKHVDAQIVHEAAIGRINDEQLVKLRTFGMSEEEAEAVIIENFLN